MIGRIATDLFIAAAQAPTGGSAPGATPGSGGRGAGFDPFLVLVLAVIAVTVTATLLFVVFMHARARKRAR